MGLVIENETWTRKEKSAKNSFQWYCPQTHEKCWKLRKKKKKKEKKDQSLIKKYSKILFLIEKLFTFMLLLKTFVKGIIILLWSRAEYLIK